MKRLGIAIASTSLALTTTLVAIGLTMADTKKAPPKDPPKPAAPVMSKPSTKPIEWYVNPTTNQTTWERPAMPTGKEGELIQYGIELTKNTYQLLGPNSKTPYFTKRHNCTNCHLDLAQSAHSSPWIVTEFKFGGEGRFEPREGRKVTISTRVDECFRRTLGGKPLPHDSREQLAIEAYIKWLSTGVKVKVTPKGNEWETVMGLGTPDVPLLTRAADPVRGKQVFKNMCAPCHGEDGKGTFDKKRDRVIFPPLWGDDAFGQSAGMSMLPFAVKFIKANMPYGFANASDPNRQLPLEDAWDVAAYIVYQPRSEFPESVKDWSGFAADCMPNWLNKKPHAGFPPYFPRVKPDGTMTGDLKYPAKYSEEQHKYGPFQEIFADLNTLKAEYLKKPNKAPNCKPWPAE